MTEYDELLDPGAVDPLIGPEPSDHHDLQLAIGQLSDGQDHLFEAQRQLHQEFENLAANFERLASHLAPLLTKQFEDTQYRMRVLESRLRNRQERPLLVRIATLLADVRRLEAAEDIKTHVEEALMAALNGLGYQEIGQEGETFDPLLHEPVSGATGKSGIVRNVFSSGLECHGDVLIKARVDVEPITDSDLEQGRFPA
jgi:molecular chaperone GrpE (heat shock protein)